MATASLFRFAKSSKYDKPANTANVKNKLWLLSCRTTECLNETTTKLDSVRAGNFSSLRVLRSQIRHIAKAAIMAAAVVNSHWEPVMLTASEYVDTMSSEPPIHWRKFSIDRNSTHEDNVKAVV